MKKTKSEELFERFCAEHQLRCDPVPTGPQRTPDYDLYVASHQIVVEVKQLEPNRADAETLARFKAEGFAPFGAEAGKRVRQEIKDARKQLRNRAKGQHPALLVLYNNVELMHYLDPMFVLLGMYGELTATVAIPSAPGARSFLTDFRFGRKATVRMNENTTLSAVCVLINNPAGEPTLTFYHNHFAAFPFEPNWLRGDRTKHYLVQDPGSRRFGFWVER